MRKKELGIIAAAFLLMLSGFPATAVRAGENASPSECGALRVEGTHLVDSNGERVQLKGISTHGISWFPEYINREAFRQFHEEWNANVIRLAMYTAESGGYCTDGDKEYLKNLVKDGVSYAAGNDMYVIIDWHILSDNNPNLHMEESKDFFREMSEEYKDCNNILYEICNEPNGGTSWGEIKAYAEEIIPVIRENDEDAVILVGTPNWSQFVDQAAEDPISGYENIMYVVHFYAATHKEDLRSRMVSAIEKGVPVFVSEYGICDASGNGAIDVEQADQWVDLMDEYGISYVAWNLSNKNETSAILNNSCTKTSGFEEGDLSSSGKWLYEMLSGKEIKTTPKDGKEDSSAVIFTAGKLKVTASVANSWESDGQFFFQYSVTLENISETDQTEWEIELPFSGKIALSDGWNGEYTVDEQSLHVINKDYNGKIASGEKLSDIGFIISGDKSLECVGETDHV